MLQLAYRLPASPPGSDNRGGKNYRLPGITLDR
jgi:hypothetical protein